MMTTRSSELLNYLYLLNLGQTVDLVGLGRPKVYPGTKTHQITEIKIYLLGEAPNKETLSS